MPMIIPGAQSRQVAEAMQARQPRFPAEGTAGAAGFPWQRRAAAGHDALAPGVADLNWLPGPIEDVLARRRSVRVFGPDPVPWSLLKATVTAACDAVEATWPSQCDSVGNLTVLAAAYRVDGMARGLYAPSIDPSAEPPGTDDACLEALPALYTDAPALLLICGDLNGACRAAGAAGYPSMLVRAGAIGYAAWLWAISAGLAASVYASPSHRVTGAARQLDANLRHLFTVALGVPADRGEARDGMALGHAAR
jgi:hypothetical protein